MKPVRRDGHALRCRFELADSVELPASRLDYAFVELEGRRPEGGSTRVRSKKPDMIGPLLTDYLDGVRIFLEDRRRKRATLSGFESGFQVQLERRRSGITVAARAVELVELDGPTLARAIWHAVQEVLPRLDAESGDVTWTDLRAALSAFRPDAWDPS